MSRKPDEPRAIATIAPLSIAADKKAALEQIAKRHHRNLTQHLRWMIDREIAGEEEAA